MTPAELMMLLLRPRNFFLRNPALDVPPSDSKTPSQVEAKKKNLLGKGECCNDNNKASAAI